MIFHSILINNTVKILISALLFIGVSGAKNIPSDAVLKQFDEINICENGILAILKHIDGKSDEWGFSGKRMLTLLNAKEKQELVYQWTSVLDYFAQLEYIKQRNKDFLDYRSREVDQREFTYYYLAFLTQYRYALVLLDVLERNESIHTLLNESKPDLGLKAESYTVFKAHFLNVTIASEFFALNAIYEQLVKDELEQNYRNKIQVDVGKIVTLGITRGIAMSISNAFQVMRDRSFNLWFPVQKGFSEWLGDTKVWRKNKVLITNRQIKSITAQMLPGDIMLQRREWYMTNVGLPGYWTHSALYIGTEKDRDKLWKNDSGVGDWVRSKGVESGRLDDLLLRDYPEVYNHSVTAENSSDSIRVIESVSEGVIFTSMEESAHCDGIVVLRPSLPDIDKAIAIYRSFAYWGRPYDFNFDFITDTSLVCTELIYKAYEPLSGTTGLHINTIEIGGRIVAPVNLLARQFSEEWKTPDQQLEFILFYDGYEKRRKSVPSSVEQFINSWKRPDWYFILQKN